MDTAGRNDKEAREARDAATAKVFDSFHRLKDAIDSKRVFVGMVNVTKLEPKPEKLPD